MCHPWLAAGVTVALIAWTSQETRSLLRSPLPSESDRLAIGLLGGRVRVWFRARVEPIADGLLAAGLTADATTLLQLGVSLVCGVAYAGGWLFTAGWLLYACGLLDVLDGTMARKRGVPSRRGALLDSVGDRYGECAVFCGLAVYYRSTWMLWTTLAAFVGALMVSYTRARSEALGLPITVGLMQRPERYMLLGSGSIFGALLTHLACGSPLGPAVLGASVLALAVLANVTAIQRAAFALRRLE